MIRHVKLAGGCFWCISKPYYEYDGVIKVISGFCGGEEVNPTYEDVKHGLTGHRETIYIEYDSDVISFEELFDIYLHNIDPFDPDGQFIDRGKSYSCAFFSDDENEKQYAKKRLEELEATFGNPTYVLLTKDMPFYAAEEYHQDYAIKYPELMEIELINSGRKKKD